MVEQQPVILTGGGIPIEATAGTFEQPVLLGTRHHCPEGSGSMLRQGSPQVGQ
jgi:hypothetical protein